MKAIVKAGQEEGFRYQELPLPSLAPGEVLVEIKSATVCGSDVMFYHWYPEIRWMVRNPPFVPGHECGGVVIEVGPEVHSLKVGDRIAVETHLPCGRCYQCRTGLQHICKNMRLFGHNFNGCFAECAAVPEAIAFKISDRLDMNRAALLEPMGVAMQAVEKARVTGDSVAVIGAGPIGLMSLYLARKLGAVFTVVVDVNEYRLELAEKLGADLILEAGEDTTDRILGASGGDGVGRIIEASGSARAFTECFFYLRKGGRLVLVGNPKEDLVIRKPVQSLIHKEITLLGVHGRRMYETWEKTQGFLLEETFPLDLFVTHEFSLAEFAEAFRLIDTGNCGKVRLLPG